MNDYNPIMNTDGYKPSHWLQYPPGTSAIQSYIESRGGDYPVTVFYGLQAFLKDYMTTPVTNAHIAEAKDFMAEYGAPFNEEGWKYIVNKHGGYFPIRIKSVAEGTVVPVSNALVTVENIDDDPRLRGITEGVRENGFWTPSYIETAILRGVWYPTTVATVSWSIKQTIRKFMEDTADEDDWALDFRLHDFGARGVSSFESSGIGGSAHLVNFMGTDTIEAIRYARRHYNTKSMLGYTVPAAEHSSITTWGRNGEADAYFNMLKQFGGKYANIAVVSDSYDIYNAVENLWGGSLKQEVIDSGSMLVVRPDSGDPPAVVLKVAQLLEAKFGFTINSKGYKMLKNVRIIQGDGINEKSIRDILTTLKAHNYSAANVLFGMGGALLQQVNRDTQKWAMKASWALIGGREIDVFKDPITDTGKRSKKGQLMLYQNRDTFNFHTGPVGQEKQGFLPMLNSTYETGRILRECTFEQIREINERSTIEWNEAR